VLLLRLLAVLLLIAVGAVGLAGAVTRDPRYFALARRLLKYGVIVAAMVAAFMLLERVFVTVV